MSTEDAVKRAYTMLQNHRAVAAKLGLSIAYVLYVLGFMSEDLYIRSC
jgi:hypothetical protein